MARPVIVIARNGPQLPIAHIQSDLAPAWRFVGCANEFVGYLKFFLLPNRSEITGYNQLGLWFFLVQGVDEVIKIPQRILRMAKHSFESPSLPKQFSSPSFLLTRLTEVEI
jgi:hypothetical protein